MVILSSFIYIYITYYIHMFVSFWLQRSARLPVMMNRSTMPVAAYDGCAYGLVAIVQ